MQDAGNGTTCGGAPARCAWAEIIARDPRPWAGCLTALGFQDDPAALAAGPGAVLRLGAARVLVTVPERAGSPEDRWLDEHGEGVWDVALAVPDMERALTALRQGGGRTIGPQRRRDVRGYGPADTAVALVPGAGIRHTLVEERLPAPPRGGGHALDHVALAVPAGKADEVAAGYARALGLAWTPAERVVVGPEGLESGVLDGGPGCTIVLVSQDPSMQSGQVDAFLAANGGPGVQHLAFRRPDITAAVRAAAARGTRFLPVPAAYYDALPARVPAAAGRLGDLRDLGVLADTDSSGGTLYQVFTARPAPPSEAFFELVERRGGARGFGTSNIANLYAARQAEEAARAGAAGSA